MSFRLFIYYCAAWGAATAFLGWILGQIIEGDDPLLGPALQAMSLGLLLSLGLGLVDSVASGAQRDRVSLIVYLIMTVLIGTVGGFLGGLLGQFIYSKVEWSSFLVFGWTLIGLLIGVAPSAFDYLGTVMRKEDRRGPQRKLRNGLIGGTIGGLIGGLVSILLHSAWAGVKEAGGQKMWSPSATGFVALGACIGLAMSLTQVILREAWLRVESGFRPGRQLLLTKPETLIGRAELCDLGLFGDSTVEKQHARIVREGDRWMLSDMGTPGGTLLNGQPIAGPTPLRSSDMIQVGGSVLSFGVRAKEPAPAPVAIPVGS